MSTNARTARTRVSRAAAVLVIAVVAGLAAVWIAPRTSVAVAAWMQTTPVSTRTVRVSGGLPVLNASAASRAAQAASSVSAASSATDVETSTAAASSTGVATIDVGMSFTMVGVICDLPEASGDVTVRLRTSADGASWSAWHDAPLQVSETTEGPSEAYTDPLWTGDAAYVQVVAEVAGTGAPAELAGVRVMALDPTGDAGAVAAVTETVRRAAAKIAGVGFAAEADAAVSQPTIVTRSQWGADESLRSGSPSYATVKMAFVHHTDSGNTYKASEGPAYVRGIYAYHTSGLGWNDIGYNFLIDRYGKIYEGRYGGIKRGVVGAQALGFNTGSTGISVIGTFTSVAPPSAAMTSLKKLLAWKLDVHGLKATGKASMTCGSTEKYREGASVTLPVIAGHRDANYTSCPGDKLYALLPGVRTAVYRLMNPTKWVVTLSLSASSVRRDRNVSFSGTVKTVTGKAGSGSVTIQRRRASETTWKAWRTATLDGKGAYSVTVKMINAQSWKVRARMPGNDAHLTGFSSTKSLLVY